MSSPTVTEKARRIIPLVQIAADATPADEVEQSLFEVRKKIYPRKLHGWFAGWRWSLVWFTQLLFYGLPWLNWGGRQVVLFNLGERKFYLFGYIFWPQDFIYLTALLICSALALFLFTAVGGRLWCGYACPQTVYTEIFLWMERKVEGDRYARMKLDAKPMDMEKLTKKIIKQVFWILFSLQTGLTFVGYFTPIRQLVPEIWNVSLGPWELFWILFYGFATYGNAGYMREQVCKYMCPYARFQSAMFDKDTLIITYDAARGETRGSRSKKADYKQQGLGDCVDCGVCVEVCPTGIDIRNGLQYECIGCAACIDSCDQIMDRMGYPRGLIRYATENSLKGGWTSAQMWKRVFRPRVLVYGAVLGSVVVATAVTLVTRMPLKVDIIRDRGTLAREVEDGWIENVYRVQIMNQDEESHHYRISAKGIADIHVDGTGEFTLPAATSRVVPVALRIPPQAVQSGGLQAGSHKIEIEVEAEDKPLVHDEERAVFLVPR